MAIGQFLEGGAELVVEVKLYGERVELANEHGAVEAGDGEDVGAELLASLGDLLADELHEPVTLLLGIGDRHCRGDDADFGVVGYFDAGDKQTDLANDFENFGVGSERAQNAQAGLKRAGGVIGFAREKTAPRAGTENAHGALMELKRVGALHGGGEPPDGFLDRDGLAIGVLGGAADRDRGAEVVGGSPDYHGGRTVRRVKGEGEAGGIGNGKCGRGGEGGQGYEQGRVDSHEGRRLKTGGALR